MTPDPEFAVNTESFIEAETQLEELQATSTGLNNLAIVFAPPSNVLAAPNGIILGSVTNQVSINIYGSNGDWFKTDACEEMGGGDSP